MNEAQLSAELGVSRAPIREAINRIEHEGFVRVMPKKGIYVTDVAQHGLDYIPYAPEGTPKAALPFKRRWKGKR